MTRRAYDPKTIEPRWQDRWEAEGAFCALDADDRPKKYVLDMFPYPSGDGLHLGHVENYTISDLVARYARARGFNVLHPSGWDAFGLPAEQYAIDEQVHPREAVLRNIDVFKAQMRRLGWSIDWSREVNTTDTGYYKWTQWIFLKLLQKGLAYQAEIPVNWCPELGTVLANEEVIDGKSERGGFPVVRKPMRQWLLRITAYADRLLEDLEDLDWPEHIKQMQREWIGRSEGAEVTFKVGEGEFTVFTTRPDTLFGATFCALAPEHPLVEEITTPEHRDEVKAYVERTSRRSERDRLAETERTGVFSGAYARNPVNGEEIPVWIADYVLFGYGSGAVMAVPGHDQRDWEFASTFDLPIKEVVTGGDLTKEAHEGDGTMVHSSFLDGLSVAEGKARIVEWLSEEGYGRPKVQYRLRDWLFSRQRYWGEPFPIVHTDDGRVVPIPEDQLPVVLPDVQSYKPTGTGESPLAAIPSWVDTTDPETGEPAKRETDTMPQWAGSCWYYLRFADPNNDRAFVSQDNEKYWLPVDIYIGGAEHAVLHLLYARFWHKVLYDLGLVHTKEPFKKLVNQGMIRCPSYRESENSPYLTYDEVEVKGGTAYVKSTGKPAYSVIEKMSKSKKNVLNPDDYVDEYGADAIRLYVMFMGPPDADKIWSDADIEGVKRFLNRAWRLIVGDDRYEPAPTTDAKADGADAQLLHATIQAVTDDMETLGFNTAISRLMELLNGMYKISGAGDTKAEGRPLPTEMVDSFLRMLSPLAPHIAEEMWEMTGREGLVCNATWPTYDPGLAKADEVEIAVQVNGKVRGKVTVPADAEQDVVLAAAKDLDRVQKHLEGKTIRKEMVVPGRLVVLVAN